MIGNPNVLQFKITLRLPTPIWRRILVPEHYSFWDLSAAIQDAMGNADSRLHFFRIRNPHTLRMDVIGAPKDEKSLPFCKVNGVETFISDYFSFANQNAVYVYNNRKYWQYEICFERKRLMILGEKYPQCIDGQRANPPRQFQNVFKFIYFLDYVEVYKHDKEILKTKLQDLMGEEFNFEEFHLNEFDPKAVKFEDPNKRLKIAEN